MSCVPISGTLKNILKVAWLRMIAENLLLNIGYALTHVRPHLLNFDHQPEQKMSKVKNTDKSPEE